MIQIGFESDKGKVRDTNEDSYFVIPADDIGIVADGVGGNNAGDLASRTAVEVVANYVRDGDISKCLTEESICEFFGEALQQANDRICELALSSPDKTGMATTMVLAYIRDEDVYFVNIGDSRAYIVHQNVLVQITKDHTYVNTLVQQGTISAEDAKQHSQRNVITRALGISETASPDFYKSKVSEGDIILLCSDGLYDEVSEGEILEILMNGENENASEIASTLVDRANTNGGYDNITVICFRI